MAGDTSSRRGRVSRQVLVVEDDEFNRQLLVTLLSNDFDVIEAEDGLQGLAALEEHCQTLSLVLLDIYMPNLDGFEFLRRKRLDERCKAVPVIVTTAGGSTKDEMRCLELGANDFVVKPYDFSILANRMNNLIDLRESTVIVSELTWDETTGLLSKEFFYRAVAGELTRVLDAPFSLVVSDVENFKSLNERYGEASCDELLRQLADRLSAALPGDVDGGRIGPDMLAFLVEGADLPWEELLRATADGLCVPNANVKFGVVADVDHSLQVTQLCNRAISTVETVKGLYGCAVALFDDKIHQQQLLEQTIRESMESALDEKQFTVVFQPKFNVREGRVGGAEALVRWVHPEVGFISPGVFITLFERNGFITKLDLFVWEEACKEVARCRELGLPQVPISVNASRLDFDLSDLPERFAALADAYDVDHRLLRVELTETAYSENPAVVTILARLRDLGFSTELDDFGSGYSSLVSLNTLPLDVMKLDMSMVRKASELDDFRIVESTINLAQVLGLMTVVEGVETEQEASRVTEMGCDYIQGYFYSRPLPRDDFERYLRESLG